MTDKSTLLTAPQAEDPTSLKYMLKLAAPVVVTTISFTIMQFVDRYMVSWLGTEALAAILPAGVVSFIPGTFAIGMMASLNTFVSQSFGRGERSNCSHYFWQALCAGLVYSAVILVLMWPVASWIFRIMGQPAEIVGLEVTYFRIMLYAHILAVVNWSSGQFFMGIHRPIITMYISFCGQAINVAANYVLIFGKFGFPQMGIAGAGWGTFIGVGVAAVMNLCVFLSPNINRAFNSRHTFKIDFGKMYDLLKIGLPAGLALMTNVALWGMILCALIGRFGKEALAATSAVLSYTSLSIMPVVGIATALSAAVGRTIGQSKSDLAVRQTSICLRIALIYMGVVGACFFAFRKPLMVFWSSDNEVIEAGTKILICAAFYQVFHAARTIYGGSLRGAGDTMWLAVTSAAGAVVLGLGGLLTMVLIPRLGYTGPWIAAAVSIMAVSLANRQRFKSNKWMDIDLFKRRAVGLPVETGG